MSKKQLNRKKLNIKLVPGETAVAMSYDIFMHIAATYDFLSTEQDNESDAQAFRDIADSIRYQSEENNFLSDDEYEDW
jgi:hypothetical protein